MKGSGCHAPGLSLMSIALDPLVRAPRRALPRALSRLAVVAGFAAYAGLVYAAWHLIVSRLPDAVTLSLPGHELHLHNLRDKILGNATLVAIILPAALWLECFFLGWEKSSARAL